MFRVECRVSRSSLARKQTPSVTQNARSAIHSKVNQESFFRRMGSCEQIQIHIPRLAWSVHFGNDCQAPCATEAIAPRLSGTSDCQTTQMMQLLPLCYIGLDTHAVTYPVYNCFSTHISWYESSGIRALFLLFIFYDLCCSRSLLSPIGRWLWVRGSRKTRCDQSVNDASLCNMSFRAKTMYHDRLSPPSAALTTLRLYSSFKIYRQLCLWPTTSS